MGLALICQGKVFLVQSLHLLLQMCQVTVINDDIICLLQALLARNLRPHNGTNFVCTQSATRHCADNLLLFIAIYYQDTSYHFTVIASFKQQRHDHYHIRRRSKCGAAGCFHVDKRMEDCFKFMPRGAVGKYQAAHFFPVQCTFRSDEIFTKILPYRANGGAVRLGKFMRDLIGINNVGTQSGEEFGSAGFAATDSSG